MHLKHRIEGQFCIVRVHGDLAVQGVNQLKNYTKPFLDDRSLKGVLLNMEKVSIIDSTGLGLIMSIAKTLEQNHTKLVLCHIQHQAQEFLTRTFVHELLEIYPTEREALEQLIPDS